MQVPDDHEWVRVDGRRITIGITDYAQDALGDVVFVQLPEVGRDVTAGASMGEVESTKSVSDVYAPLTGRVVAVNDALADGPAALNEDPYGTGWLVVLEVDDPAAAAELLDAGGYRALIGD
jgi:glycine cleavage system H protein